LKLDGSEWSTFCPTCFTPGEGTLGPLNRWLGRPESKSGHFGEEKKSLVIDAGIICSLCCGHIFIKCKIVNSGCVKISLVVIYDNS